MPHSIEQLDYSAPVILARIDQPVNLDAEARQLLRELDSLLAGIQGKQVYLIVDMSTLELTLKELVLAVTSIRQAGDELATAHVFDPRVRVLLVETGHLLGVMVDSLGEGNPGFQRAEAFKTLDGALAHVSQLIGKPRKKAGLEGATMPGAMLRRDIPAPVVYYQLTSNQVFANNWEQMALEIVTMLAGIEGDAAYLVIEAPRIDTTLAEMTALLAPTNQPHGGNEISRTIGSRRVTISTGDNNLHVVVTGLQHGQYDEAYRRMFKVIRRALDQINQAWAVIRTIKGAFGVHVAGIDQVFHREN